MLVMCSGSAERGDCSWRVAGPMAPSIPGCTRARLAQPPTGWPEPAECGCPWAGGERAANVGLSIVFIKRQGFGVYQGKTTRLY